jgi:hypothetical protein
MTIRFSVEISFLTFSTLQFSQQERPTPLPKQGSPTTPVIKQELSLLHIKKRIHFFSVDHAKLSTGPIFAE